jgi:hypothetical protein
LRSLYKKESIALKTFNSRSHQQISKNCQNPPANSDKKISSSNKPNRTMNNNLITLGLLGLTSCTSAIPQTINNNLSTTQQPAATTSPKNPLPTLHIAIGIDRTGSKANNKVPDMTQTQLRTLATGLQQRGGELRITTICSDSDKAMLHLNFTPPTQPPTAPTLDKIDDKSNPFDNTKIRDKNQAKLEQHKTIQAEFDRQQQTKATTDQAQIDTFLQQVAPLINQPATCAASDMIGIVKRSDLFLQERQPAGSDNPRKVLFLVTDGEHTATKAQQVPALQSTAEVVIVSSGKGAGIFEPLKPVKFDSIDAAIVDILSR